MVEIVTMDNVPEDLLNEMLTPPQLKVTRRCKKYTYGEVEIKGSDIIIAKKNPNSIRVKEYIKAVEGIEKEWEFVSFKTIKHIQIRKYRRPTI